MNVYWLEQSDGDVPVGDGWLSAGERATLDRLRIPKRRADWRLGRWTAKCAAAAYLNLECTSGGPGSSRAAARGFRRAGAFRPRAAGARVHFPEP